MPHIISGRVGWHFDERIYVELDPNQEIDLPPLISPGGGFFVHERGSGHVPKRFEYQGDASWMIQRLAIDDPDTLVEAWTDGRTGHRSRFVGPWWQGNGQEGEIFHVPCRASFSLTAKNLAATRRWSRIWLRIAVNASRY